eukprot:CAMPEP_0185745586 /NCGR_PEP_ID=MMETSP1174-20130828/3971_1 /TAXON_ID=35687 /ORGANISM="Dictyocha speculum, Strain CCMP1381" /LENGTH=112 /DNA_ID=CAMNT_0028419701 /DNA_START=79 /DNA_END=417 /DNA_ORIENTATION=+
MGAAEEARAEALVEGKDPFVPQHADRRVPDAGVKLTAAFLGLMLPRRPRVGVRRAAGMPTDICCVTSLVRITHRGFVNVSVITPAHIAALTRTGVEVTGRDVLEDSSVFMNS